MLKLGHQTSVSPYSNSYCMRDLWYPGWSRLPRVLDMINISAARWRTLSANQKRDSEFNVYNNRSSRKSNANNPIVSKLHLSSLHTLFNMKQGSGRFLTWSKEAAASFLTTAHFFFFDAHHWQQEHRTLLKLSFRYGPLNLEWGHESVGTCTLFI